MEGRRRSTQRDFPRSSTSSIACSLTASPSLAISARAAANSASCCWAARTPGLDAASASSAPCLATWRMRMTVERSTPKRSAASLWLSSPVTSCSHSSYFSLGLRNRLARRPRRSRPESCWVISTLPLEAEGPYRMRRNQNPEVGHEVRRKPQLDHLNGPLLLRDTVIEQHRSLTEDLHRVLVELLAKRVLDGDQLAERLQRGGEVAPAGVRQRGNRSADRLGADPEGFDHPGRGRSRSSNTMTRSVGARWRRRAMRATTGPLSFM